MLYISHFKRCQFKALLCLDMEDNLIAHPSKAAAAVNPTQEIITIQKTCHNEVWVLTIS